MARIRTVKPEIWTSEQFVECSPNARLLFIGMFNFCDDGGIHPASIKRLKMEIYPGDDYSQEQMAEWIKELINNGLIALFSHENKEYWAVTGWKHQKIDRPTYRYPQLKNREPLAETSPSSQRDNSERLPPEGNGGESNGGESNGKALTPDELNTSAWLEYIKYRKEAKFKKLTQSGELKAIKQLISFGDKETQQKIIDKTIANGWTGLFELKNKKSLMPPSQVKELKP